MMNTSKQEIIQIGSQSTFGSSKVLLSRIRAVLGILLCAHSVDNPLLCAMVHLGFTSAKLMNEMGT